MITGTFALFASARLTLSEGKDQQCGLEFHPKYWVLAMYVQLYHVGCSTTQIPLSKCGICCQYKTGQGGGYEKDDQHDWTTLIIIPHICTPQNLYSPPLVHEQSIYHEKNCDGGNNDSSILQRQTHTSLATSKLLFTNTWQKRHVRLLSRSRNHGDHHLTS